jgi:hypothetical protein
MELEDGEIVKKNKKVVDPKKIQDYKNFRKALRELVNDKKSRKKLKKIASDGGANEKIIKAANKNGKEFFAKYSIVRDRCGRKKVNGRAGCYDIFTKNIKFYKRTSCYKK